MNEAERAKQRSVESREKSDLRDRCGDCSFQSSLHGKRALWEDALEAAREGLFYAQQSRDPGLLKSAHMRYAECLFELGRCEETIDSLRFVLRNRRSESYFRRFRVLEFLGDFHHAQAKSVMNKNQNPAQEKESLGRGLREVSRAIQCYKLAEKIGTIIDARLDTNQYGKVIKSSVEKLQKTKNNLRNLAETVSRVSAPERSGLV